VLLNRLFLILVLLVIPFISGCNPLDPFGIKQNRREIEQGRIEALQRARSLYANNKITYEEYREEIGEINSEYAGIESEYSQGIAQVANDWEQSTPAYRPTVDDSAWQAQQAQYQAQQDQEWQQIQAGRANIQEQEAQSEQEAQQEKQEQQIRLLKAQAQQQEERNNPQYGPCYTPGCLGNEPQN